MHFISKEMKNLFSGFSIVYFFHFNSQKKKSSYQLKEITSVCNTLIKFILTS